MKKEFLKKLILFRNFATPEVVRLLYASFGVGLYIFIAEYAFLFVLQIFLTTIGITSSTNSALPSWRPQTVLASLAMLVIFGVLRSLGYFLKQYFTQMSYHVYIRNKRQKIINFSLTHALELSTSEIIDIFSEAINRSANAIQSLALLSVAVVTAGLLLLLGLKIAPLEMFICLIILAFLAYPLKKFEISVSKAAEGLRSEWVQVNTTLINGIKNNFFLKIYGLIKNEQKKANQNLDNYFDHHKKYNFNYALKSAMPPAVGIFVVSIVTYISLTYFKTQGLILLSFFYIFMRFIQSASEVLTGVGDVRLMLTNVKFLYNWEQKLNQISLNKAPHYQESRFSQEFKKSLEQGRMKLEADQVFFKYSDDMPAILENLNFTLNKGECLVIAGESGSGKSTLLSLILGVNTPTRGHIKINDFDINTVREELFKNIGYVGPEPYLIEGTVLDNLLYGHPHADNVKEQDVANVLKAANAYEFVQQLPDKENTFLNEFAKLSTGQKQRLAIARVLLRKPILLVMDECTANLDAQNEADIIKMLSSIKEETTMIVVTHKQAFNVLSENQVLLTPSEKKIYI